MNVKILQERLESYKCQSILEEEFALKEIIQELILYSLYNTDFFKKAAFQGGTCLRIFYGLNRFSEDLDFALHTVDKSFVLNKYLSEITELLKEMGLEIKVTDRSRADSNVRSAFLKDDSLGKIINTNYISKNTNKIIKIKLEIDTNPPSGAETELKYHNFPNNFAVSCHDTRSLFAGKIHALLCREYIKGRDWFDFLWYISKKIEPNYDLLSNATNQQGPWKNKNIKIDLNWFKKEMSKKIKSIDWKTATESVEPFLKLIDRKSLELWNKDFFLFNLSKL